MRRYFIFCVVLLPVLFSCNKKPENEAAPGTTGVYITNEGNFNFGNGEISFYNPTTNQVSNNLFKSANNYNLGDVVQSMYIKDSLGFIVVNNSQKIEVVKIPSLLHVRTIVLPNSSPRYLLPINDSIAYVSDLYNSEIHVINYLTGTLVSEISGVMEWTEHILLNGNNVIVQEENLSASPSATGNVVVINSTNNTVVKQYSFPGSNLNGIAKDNQGRIWLALDNDSANSIPASLYCLNADMTVNKIIKIGSGHHPMNLCIDGAGAELYFFDGDIDRLSINDTVAPANYFVAGGGRNFYGLNVDPGNGDVYASDAIDYVQPSKIYRYDKNANLIESFSAGVISGNFVFHE